MNLTVNQAFRAVQRVNFLPPAIQPDAGLDQPLPVGYGQTNSQPSTVREMLGWLDAQPGETVLDVGSGTGWTSALLASIVGQDGKIFAVEKLPQLLHFGQDNCDALGITNIEFHEAGKVFGLPDKAPFDRILVSAAAHDVPHELIDQLKPGGKMVIPVGNDILEISKDQSAALTIIYHHGYVFVPLV